MSTHDDGGPAFPVYDHHGDGQQFLAQIGMTLRDYFAAKALASKQFTVTPYDNTDAVARDCYRMADAMLKARGGAQ